MGAQRRSLLFRQFSEIGFSHGALFYRLLILAQHCGRLSTIFNRGSRRAWWPPSLSSSVLSSGFRVQLCALRPALRSALCTLVLCALRLAPRSALCFNTTLTSVRPRLRFGYSRRDLDPAAPWFICIRSGTFRLLLAVPPLHFRYQTPSVTSGSIGYHST
jgi:hypothetical protein